MKPTALSGYGSHRHGMLKGSELTGMVEQHGVAICPAKTGEARLMLHKLKSRANQRGGPYQAHLKEILANSRRD